MLKPYLTQRTIPAAATVLALIAITATLGCTHDRPLRMTLPDHVETPPVMAVLLFVDGFGDDQLTHHLAQGDLPNIDKYLIQSGTRVQHAFACMPSITYANTVTFLTGLVPGHHGIVGNRWFDRYSLLYEEYAHMKTYRNTDRELVTPTIYDVLYDRFSVNIQCATRRGATHTIDNWMTSGINWFFKGYREVDKLIAMRFELIAEIAETTGHWPSFIHAYFPGLDETLHRYGLGTPQHLAALRNVDEQIGRICRGLERAGLLDRTYLMLVSDHGHVATSRTHWIDLPAWLRKNHGRTVHDGLYLNDSYEDRAAHFARFDTVVAIDGARKAAIHLRSPKGWHHPADPAILRRLVAQPSQDGPAAIPVWRIEGVALIAYPTAADRVELVNARGRAAVERQRVGGRLTYTYSPDTGDPLGYMKNPDLATFVQAGPHGSRDWLAATATCEIPDLVGQIVEMFDSSRTGDIVLFTAPGWDFSPADVSGHGSVFAQEMRVPMVIAGPGIPAGGRLDYARTSDVMPTLVELLGAGDRLAHSGRLDGVSLVRQLLAADQPHPVTTRPLP